mmetsp:Transcript_60666/g.141888  ORF Transcript_60666/g.141888 Transcript_60666/m.141888 type:complete len:285 (-) Transcript_60666:1617-2471(-)
MLANKELLLQYAAPLLRGLVLVLNHLLGLLELVPRPDQVVLVRMGSVLEIDLFRSNVFPANLPRILATTDMSRKGDLENVADLPTDDPILPLSQFIWTKDTIVSPCMRGLRRRIEALLEVSVSVDLELASCLQNLDLCGVDPPFVGFLLHVVEGPKRMITDEGHGMREALLAKRGDRVGSARFLPLYPLVLSLHVEADPILTARMALHACVGVCHWHLADICRVSNIGWNVVICKRDDAGDAILEGVAIQAFVLPFVDEPGLLLHARDPPREGLVDISFWSHHG